ncbi:hypothetical protein PVAP13_8NG330000 [Panicum virgatum]|uniref:PGG domain-containing protein n=1 Tax=Panicum virgatum TaxID=38727 RepID=A0A8T0PKY7_PANVG|nr:hypothetical protein PVAP13_8NG330000 [Panicum virgatum]
MAEDTNKQQSLGSTEYQLKKYLLLAVMLVDALGLVGAYAGGGSHDRFTTVCAAVLLSGVALYGVGAFLTYFARHPPDLRLRCRRRGAAEVPQRRPPPAGKLGKKHEILLVLAIFAATNAYVAGLNPPGGFWRLEGHRAAGDPVLQGAHPRRYRAFFFFNTTAFAASLLAITLIMDYEKLDLDEGKIEQQPRVVALYGLIVTELLGLGGAYAAGSCRDRKHSAQVLLLLLPVVAWISLQQVLVQVLRRINPKKLLPCTDEGEGCCGSLIKSFKNSRITSYICAVRIGGMSEDLKRTR